MLIFYGESIGRPNVQASGPVSESANAVIDIYRGLDLRRGFLGIMVDPNIVIHIFPGKGGKIRVELLNRSSASFDRAWAETQFGEQLIMAIEAGDDALALARKELSGWEHVELRKRSTGGKLVFEPIQRISAPIKITFFATEAGFKEGLGGASNAKGNEKYHYLLFGCQEDPQHPDNSGIYFEYDDQSHGRINSVDEIGIGDNTVDFKLKDGKSIEVNCAVSAKEWRDFAEGIRNVFPSNMERRS